MSAVDTLEELKAYIQEHGWTKREFKTASGRVCVAGGLRMVVIGHTHYQRGEGTDEVCQRYTEAFRLLKRAAVRQDVIRTNDEICKDPADVYRWIDRAIVMGKADEAIEEALREPACV